VTPEDAPEGYADAEAIGIGIGLATGSIYRWASIDQWRRIRHAGRTLYDLNDVDTTMVRLDTVTSSEA